MLCPQLALTPPTRRVSLHAASPSPASLCQEKPGKFVRICWEWEEGAAGSPSGLGIPDPQPWRQEGSTAHQARDLGKSQSPPFPSPRAKIQSAPAPAPAPAGEQPLRGSWGLECLALPVACGLVLGASGCGGRSPATLSRRKTGPESAVVSLTLVPRRGCPRRPPKPPSCAQSLRSNLMPLPPATDGTVRPGLPLLTSCTALAHLPPTPRCWSPRPCRECSSAPPQLLSAPAPPTKELGDSCPYVSLPGADPVPFPPVSPGKVGAKTVSSERAGMTGGVGTGGADDNRDA